MQRVKFARRLERFLFNHSFTDQQLDRPPLIVNERDASILTWIPSGEFVMGDWQISNRPEHRVYLDGYYLGVHCITNRQYQRFVKATGHRIPDQTKCKTPIWHGQRYRTAYADHPVVCVSWEDAQAYCAWAGLALPTEAQWERGVRGRGKFYYPWGNDNWDAGKCQCCGNHGVETTSPVFAYPQGVSGFGTMNQSGNVWEWCRDWYDKDYYRNSPQRNPAGPSSGSNRVIRGGSWINGSAKSFLAAYRHYDEPANRNANIGFRPCLPPGQQPG